MDQVWSINEVRKQTRVSRKTLNAAVDKGELKCLVIGKERKFRESDIDAWMDLLASRTQKKEGNE